MNESRINTVASVDQVDEIRRLDFVAFQRSGYFLRRGVVERRHFLLAVWALAPAFPARTAANAETANHPQERGNCDAFVKDPNLQSYSRCLVLTFDSLEFFGFLANFSDALFMQYRFPVGFGPSSKTCPRCALQREQCTSVRS